MNFIILKLSKSVPPFFMNWLRRCFNFKRCVLCMHCDLSLSNFSLCKFYDKKIGGISHHITEKCPQYIIKHGREICIMCHDLYTYKAVNKEIVIGCGCGKSNFFFLPKYNKPFF